MKMADLKKLPWPTYKHSTCLNGLKKVAVKFPGIKVDWLAIERVLGQGPPAILTKNTPPEHLDMATVEHYLRKWADDISKKNRIKEANYLRMAADVLTEMRAQFYWADSIT
jgi:hypothetical protein